MYDLIVIGGGFSGVAAACAAAREGLSVLLIEKNGYLGGAACNCYVNPFMDYLVWLNGEWRFIADGIFHEIFDRLDKLGAIHQNRCIFNEEILKHVLDDLTDESGVNVLFHTYLIGAETENGAIKSVTVANKSGIQNFEARYFVDASGDAELAVRSGCSYRIGRPEDGYCQPMTLCFRISNIDIEKLTEFGGGRNPRLLVSEMYRQWQKEGKISNPREDVLYFGNITKGILHFNSTRIIKLCPVDAFELSKAERLARKQVLELYNFMKGNIPGFENCVLQASAPEIGIRESRMIDGDYILTGEDVKSCKKFDDAIAACNYDIDIHNPVGSGTSYYHFQPGEYYTIPYRSLIPIGLNNLLVAGRCISSTHEAQSSYRIMPICATLGQAAGVAVSVCAKTDSDTRTVSILDIQNKLREQGAFLGI